MIYIQLKNFFNNLGIKSVDLESPDMLKIVITNNRTDLYQCFKNNAFNLDNILFIIDNSNSINDCMILEQLNLNKFNKESIIKTLINKSYFKLLSIFENDFNNNINLLDIFINNIKDYNCDINLLKNIFLKANKKVEMIKELLNNSRYDLLAFLINDIKGELLSYVKDNIQNIIEYMDFLQIKLNVHDFMVDSELFDIYFFNGYYQAIESVKYLGANQLIKYINNNTEILKKYIEYVKEEKLSLEYIKYIKNFQNSKELLKIAFSKNEFKYIEYFNNSAWDLELSLMFINSNVNSKKIESFRNNHLFDYYINRFTYRYVYKSTYNNLFDLTNIQSIYKCLGIYDDILNGKIEINSNIIRLYKFLGECRSASICYLTYALIDNDINNIDKLIDINGITPYYFSFLKYDSAFIKLKGESILDEIDKINYGTYLKMLNLHPDMGKYLNTLYINDSNIDKYINNNSLTILAIKKLYLNNQMNALKILIDNNYELELTEIEKAIIIKCNSIKSSEQEKIFFEYCLKNNDITIEQVDRIYELINRINNSNSYEIRKQADRFIKKLSQKDNFLEIFDEVEALLTEGRIPEFLKRFVVFKILKDKNILDDNNITSPILKSCKTEEEAEKILLFDLFKTSLATNNNNLLHYLEIIENGEKLYQSIEKDRYLNNPNYLDDNKKVLLHEYRIRLEFVCKYLLNLQYDKTDNDYKTLYNIEKAFQNKMNMHFDFDFHIPNTYDMMLKEISPKFPSFILLKMYMSKHEILITALEEGKRYRGESIKLKQGDFLKGIYSDFLDNIIENGSFCIDLLGEDFNQDTTHLDTDMSRLNKDYNSIPDLLSDKSLTASTWGDMKLIISYDYIKFFNEYIITKDNEGLHSFTDDDKYKTEIFNYSYSLEHYLIRSAFPMTYVSGIIATKNFDRARFIVSKNKFYIPIYDSNGNLIYTFDDYLIDRKKLQGLSFYGRSEYHISDNLLSSGIEEVIESLNKENENTNKKRQAIYNKLKTVLSKYFKGIKHQISSSVDKGIIEIIDTGSTGRGTNVPNDSDFDFIVRLDEEFIKSDKFKEFSSEIYKLFNVPVGDSKVIRIDSARVEGIDGTLKIELTIIGKNSKMDYSTDMCIQDRLSNIYKQYPDKYKKVIANIIFAKKFFKDLKIYKSYEGGFGGVGVENFILQNGGSFLEAINNFLECAKNCESVSEFKKRYHIYDYGKNHFAYAENNYKKVSFPYDDFTFSLTDVSYKKIKEEFRKYLNCNMEMVSSENHK